MAFIPVANVAQFNTFCDLAGQNVENTFYVQKSSAWSSGDLTTVAGLISGWFSVSVMAQVSQDMGFLRIGGRDLTTDAGVSVDIDISPDVGGGIASPALPNNVAAVLSLRTGLSGRSQRGRNYLAGLAENQVTNNTIAGATITSLVDAWNGLIPILSVAPYSWGVVSRFHNGAPRVAGVFNPITEVIMVGQTVKSQRRRLPGAGS